MNKWFAIFFFLILLIPRTAPAVPFKQGINKSSKEFLFCDGVCFPSFPVHERTAIFGDGNSQNGLEDDRRNLTSEETVDLRQVGMIRAAGASPGTALVVRNRRILITSANVFFDEKGKQRAPFTFYHFYPQWPEKTKIGVQKIWVGTQNPYQDKSDHNWAVVLLKEAVTEELSPLNYYSIPEKEIPAEGFEILSVGFQDDPKAKKKISACRLYQKPRILYPKVKNLYLHDCDTGNMSSGSPLLYREHSTGKYYVVGIHVGHKSRLKIRGG